MAAVVLYKDKKLGRVFKYDFKDRTVRLIDYKARKVKSMTLEELVKLVDERGKERYLDSGVPEFWLLSEVVNVWKNYSLEEILNDISRLGPQVKSGNVIVPLNVRGLEALVEKELRKRFGIRSGILDHSGVIDEPGNGNSRPDFRKLKHLIVCELLVNLKERYYVNGDVPSITSVKKMVHNLIEKYLEVSEEVES